MMLVKDINQVIKNIKLFQTELNKNNKQNDLVKALGQFSNWYAYKNESGDWLFAPSKFIGYQDISLKTYENKNENKLDGRQTDAHLKQWKVEPDEEQLIELRHNLNIFLSRYGKKTKTTANIYLLSNSSQKGEIEESKALITILKTWDKEIQKKVIADIQIYAQHLDK